MMRDLTGGRRQVRAEGRTVAEVIDSLETAFTGIRDRLCQGDRLRPTLIVTVDGSVDKLGLRARLREDSELFFLPAVSGG